jgi:hypothetical protein
MKDFEIVVEDYKVVRRTYSPEIYDKVTEAAKALDAGKMFIVPREALPTSRVDEIVKALNELYDSRKYSAIEIRQKVPNDKKKTVSVGTKLIRRV